MQFNSIYIGQNFLSHLPHSVQINNKINSEHTIYCMIYTLRHINLFHSTNKSTNFQDGTVDCNIYTIFQQNVSV